MSDQMKAFALFVLGGVLFVVTLEADWFARTLEADDKAMLCVAFFGLPYLFWELSRRINWWVVLYLVLLIPIYYTVAWTAALWLWGRMEGDGAMTAAAAAGGLIGGALALFTLKLRGLAGAGAATRNALVGTAVLTIVAGVGAWLAGAGVGGAYAAALFLYLPWQIALGWFISRMMRISPGRGEAAA